MLTLLFPIGLVLLLPMAFRRLRLRALAAAFLLSVVLYGAHRIQPPWWDTALDIREMVNALSDGTGYEGTDEYVSAGADPYELNQSAPRVSGDSAQPVPTKIASWRPDEKEFTARFSAPQDLTLRLFNYPAWRATVNGHSVRARSTEVTGQMVIPMPAGECDVRISFQRTPDRTAGGAISLLSLGVLIFAWARTRKTSTAPTS